MQAESEPETRFRKPRKPRKKKSERKKAENNNSENKNAENNNSGRCNEQANAAHMRKITNKIERMHEMLMLVLYMNMGNFKDIETVTNLFTNGGDMYHDVIRHWRAFEKDLKARIKAERESNEVDDVPQNDATDGANLLARYPVGNNYTQPSLYNGRNAFTLSSLGMNVLGAK